MIEAGAGRSVAANLDCFSSLDHHIALSLVNAGFLDRVLDHLDVFGTDTLMFLDREMLTLESAIFGRNMNNAMKRNGCAPAF